jgi:hypothetical protein
MTAAGRQWKPSWANGTDQLLAGGRYVVAAVDLDVPAVSAVSDALETILAVGPRTRLGLEPSRASRLWRYSPSAVVPVREIPADLAAGDVADVVEHIRRRPGPRHWVEANVSHRHLVMDVDHGLGDGDFVIGLIQAVLLLARGETPPLMSKPDTRAALMRALARTFAAHPGLLREAVKAARVLGPDESAADAGLPHSSWTPSYSATVIGLSAEVEAEVNRWRKANAPECGVSALWLLIARSALRAVGMDVADKVMLAFNCRRYLPEGRVVKGNFGAGLELSIRDDESMSELGRRIRRISSSGLPLAAMTLVSGITQVRPRTGPQAPAQQFRVGAPARLMYSDLGRLPQLDDAPWRPDGAPAVTGLLDPAGPESITIFGTAVRGRRSLSASFHDNVFDRALVEAALHRIEQDPLALLAGRPR